MKKTALLILGALLAGNVLAQFDYPGRKLNRLTLEIIEKAKQAAWPRAAFFLYCAWKT